jgi:hypothetical protein
MAVGSKRMSAGTDEACPGYPSEVRTASEKLDIGPCACGGHEATGVPNIKIRIPGPVAFAVFGFQAARSGPPNEFNCASEVKSVDASTNRPLAPCAGSAHKGVIPTLADVPPPGAGFVTAMATYVGLAISVAAMEAVRRVGLT